MEGGFLESKTTGRTVQDKRGNYSGIRSFKFLRASSA
jgi:hypothetical protein